MRHSELGSGINARTCHRPSHRDRDEACLGISGTGCDIVDPKAMNQNADFSEYKTDFSDKV